MKFNTQLERKFKLLLGLKLDEKIEKEYIKESQLAEIKVQTSQLIKEQEKKSNEIVRHEEIKKVEEENELENSFDEEDNQEGKEENQKEDDNDDFIPWTLPQSKKGKAWYLFTAPIKHFLHYTIVDATKDEKAKKKWPLAFFLCCIWIGVLTYFLVWWTNTLGVAFGIPSLIMGLTLLAVGNSIPDLISSVTVTREGKGNMAISCCIGSNILDIAFGLPFPWLIWSLTHGGDGLQVQTESLKISIVTLFVILCLLFFTLFMFGWKLTRCLGAIMVLIYFAFIAESMMIEYGLF